MGEDTALKGAQKPRKTWQDPARKSVDEHHVLNAESISPGLLAATIHELLTKSSRNTTIFTTTIILATIVGHTPWVLMQGRRKSRRRTPTRIPLYSY
jgi:hypothetical protein